MLHFFGTESPICLSWPETFKKRLGLFQKTACGESIDVPVTVRKNWKLTIKEVLEEFSMITKLGSFTSAS